MHAKPFLKNALRELIFVAPADAGENRVNALVFANFFLDRPYNPVGCVERPSLGKLDQEREFTLGQGRYQFGADEGRHPERRYQHDRDQPKDRRLVVQRPIDHARITGRYAVETAVEPVQQRVHDPQESPSERT